MSDSVAEVNSGLPEDRPRNPIPDSYNDQSNVDYLSFLTENKQLLQNRPEKFEEIFETLKAIDLSPSLEIQRVKGSLFRLISESENPGEDFHKIESVFIRNNLPYVAKVFKVFEILHPPEVLDEKLKSGDSEFDAYPSPVLAQSSTRMRYYTIYRDLLKADVLSGNKSLKDYISILQKGEDIAQKALDQGLGQLTPQEKTKLDHFLSKLETLYENSLLGRSKKTERINESEVMDRLAKVKDDLGVKQDQTINDRVAEMFLKPLGLTSLNELKALMRQTRRRTHKKNINYFKKNKDKGSLPLKKGDLLKGVDQRYLNSILDNGVLSYEYLGADSDSDASFTPFDIDLSMVLDEHLQDGSNREEKFESAFNRSIATSYGDIVLVFRDRDQFQKTIKNEGAVYDETKYELFNSSNSPAHFGIRTGVPSSEIDFIIVKDKEDSKALNNVFLSIATKGFYIPVVDAQGKIIFTPEMYKEYRRFSDGIMHLDGDSINAERIPEDSPLREKLDSLIKDIKESIVEVDDLYGKITNIIAEELSRQGIEFKDDLEFNWSILGAELLNIGSTARYTNVPGDYDFDMTLILDDIDFGKALKLKDQIIKRLSPTDDRSHDKFDPYSRALKYSQIRSTRSRVLPEEPDIDIGIIKRSKERKTTINDAIEEKLLFIKNYNGEEAYLDVLANIVLAKKVLKEGYVYKQNEHGGMGGIGVETWILSNSGNIINAFRSFYETARADGKIITFESFREKYRILNPGFNIRAGDFEDYLAKLNQDSYERMVAVVGNFLEKYDTDRVSEQYS